MKLDWHSPYAKRVLLTCAAVTGSAAVLLVLFRLLSDSGNLFHQLRSFLSLTGTALAPFAAALVLAYVLSPVTRFFERHFFARILRGEEKKALRRGLGVLCTYLLLALVVTLAVMQLWPVLVSNIQEFWVNAPAYLTQAEQAVRTALEEDSILSQPGITRAVQNAIDGMESWVDRLSGDALNRLISLIQSFASSVADVFIALVGSIYCLLDGPRMLRSVKRLVRAVLGERRGGRLPALGSLFESVFGTYVRYRLLESVVVFALVYLCFFLFGVPYPALFSLLNAATNLVPYFGPLVGGIATVGFLLMIDPISALYAGALVVLVQMVDAYVLGPKLMGESLNLRPLYVMLSVTAGGAFFGVPGMLLTVPCAAFVGALLSRFIDRRLSEKGKKPEDKAG